MILKSIASVGACAGLAATLLALPALADDHADDGLKRFTADRVFDLEFATDPQISPDGKTVVYVRNHMNKMTDQVTGQLWTIDTASGAHRPLVVDAPAGAPRWSPSGDRLLYSSASNGKPSLQLMYMDSGESFALAQFDTAPHSAVWSPDGSQIAFSMFVPGETPAFASPPAAPEGAKWAAPVRVFDDLTFRFDGRGFLKDGADQVFVLSADGGTPRQVTEHEAGLGQPNWLDNDTLLATGNLAEDRDLDPIESEIYAIELSDLSVSPLTSRDGPDVTPVTSPNGEMIAFVGYDDQMLSYQHANLYVMNADGSDVREIGADYTHSMGQTIWASDSKGLFVLSEDMGVLTLNKFDLRGGMSEIATDIGGTVIGRPYAGGSFSVSEGRRAKIAYTLGTVDTPSDVALVDANGRNGKMLTALNDDLLPYLDMAVVEEFKVPSSHDGLEIEAWVALPPDFEADGSFPMVLEIHGGPYAMYGPFFASEIQRYAAEGYVTVYVNPRGSSGYGEDFALEIDQAYPGYDYDDLMSVVDDLIARDYVDPDRLFVTGGSGGGILTAWIVTKTDRFAAAASIKPVINWMTMALAADIAQFTRRHWFREDPWSNPQVFLERSPISYVDQVVTPTLLMVGEEDWRTPTWEAEQFYTALKMNEVDTALIRVPGSSHLIAGRPSRIIAKTDNIMGWFAKYDPAKQTTDDENGSDSE